LSDIDRLIERALQKVRRGAPRLRTPGRYTSWVNTVCRNVYLNYVRSYRLEWLADLENIVAEARPTDNHDAGLLVETLSRVIEELPVFLQDVARLRFLAGLPYSEISARTGRPVPTLRSYANKAVNLIREHPLLKQILTELTG
jgi:RNA polymerase sigma factor (sigma-70 family)